MNSIRAISIHTNDDKSHSTLSNSHQPTSWKIEKFVNPFGKTNYKIKTDKGKNKTKSVSAAMPAFGVPGAKAYQTKHAPTLNSAVMKYSPVKYDKKKKSSSSPAKSPMITSSSITPTTTTNHRIVPTVISKQPNHCIERCVFSSSSSFSKQCLVQLNSFLPYGTQTDLLENAWIHSHLLLYPITIQHVAFFIHSKVKVKVSVWSQPLNNPSNITNIYNYSTSPLHQQANKRLIKPVQLDVKSETQLFVTVHFDSDYSGPFGIKYALYYQPLELSSFETSVIEECDISFSNHKTTTTVVNKPDEVVEKESSSSSSTTPSNTSSKKRSMTGQPSQSEKTKAIQLNTMENTIFGEVLKQQNNIPIFHKPSKEKSILQDSSHFSLLQTPQNVFQKKNNAVVEYDDSSNNTENDLKNILEILKELKQ